MIIQELQIKNFGKFSERKFSFGPGLNLVYGENESGKTTLHTFIKSCFYGLRKSRGRAAGKDTYSRYEPWNNPSYYAGNVRFRCDEKTFRLERDFQNPKNRELLVCETDGERLALEHGDLDMLLGGVGEVVFENTVFVRQMKSKTDEGLAAELKNYIANYQDGSSSVDVQESLQILKNRKKEQERKILKTKKKEEERKEKLFSRMQYMQEELQKNKDEWKELDQQRQILEEQCCVSEKETLGKNEKSANREFIRKNEKSVNRKFAGKETENERLHSVWGWRQRILAIMILILAGTGLVLSAYQNENVPATLIACGVAAYILAVGILVGGICRSRNRNKRECDLERNNRDKEDRFQKEREQEEKESGKDIRENPERLYGKLEHLAQEIKEKQLQITNLQAEINEQIDNDDREAKKNLEAISLAAAYIEETVADMQVYVGKRLKERTSEILSELTDGKYTAVELDEDLQPAVHGTEHYIPIGQLSRGTMEQVYFALRMAAGEILCQEERLPVILDDVFAMYDEVRLGKALWWLAGQKRQVLIFTCHKREEELLRRLGISFHKVQL